MAAEAASGWVAGIVAHDDYDDLPACLASLAAQSLPPAAVLVTDTGVDRERLAAVRPLAGLVTHVERRENRGYAGGANRVLEWAAGVRPAPAYVLVLNADVELDPRFAELLLARLDREPSVALASGKLLRPGRTRIDSAGITLPRHRRPRDRGSEQPDRGQFDRAERVFGVSGAAMMIRRAALPDLALDGEVFDEDFFAYHEDTDLAWRAHLLGWEVLYLPEAVAVHRRGWQRTGRRRVPAFVRRHSFANHYLQIAKNERGRDLLRHLPVLLAWEALRLGHALVRDPAVLPGYALALRLLPRALRKRRVLWARVRCPERATAPCALARVHEAAQAAAPAERSGGPPAGTAEAPERDGRPGSRWSSGGALPLP